MQTLCDVLLSEAHSPDRPEVGNEHNVTTSSLCNVTATLTLHPVSPETWRVYNISEGVNWGNVQMCASFALKNRPFTAPSSDWNHFNESLHYELHENMLPCKSQCAQFDDR